MDDELYKTTMYLATTVFSRYYSSDLATMQNWRAEWCMPNDTVRQYYVSAINMLKAIKPTYVGELNGFSN